MAKREKKDWKIFSFAIAMGSSSSSTSTNCSNCSGTLQFVLSHPHTRRLRFAHIDISFSYFIFFFSLFFRPLENAAETEHELRWHRWWAMQQPASLAQKQFSSFRSFFFLSLSLLPSSRSIFLLLPLLPLRFISTRNFNSEPFSVTSISARMNTTEERKENRLPS